MLRGICLVDKPLGVSSHHVVSRARRALGTKKVGHAGTLDPAATGLLVLGVGAGTRLLTYLVGLGKTYHATMRLGYATTTDDAEGERIDVPGGDLSTCTPEVIEAALTPYRGVISQVPSTFSAIKVDGKRAYDLAREGKEVALASREITVYRLTGAILEVTPDYIDVDLEVDCSSGTYIRALARDIGRDLGVGGHLVALRRISVGPFELENAREVDDLEESSLLPLAMAASKVMPSVDLVPDQVNDIQHGRSVSCPGAQQNVPLAALDGATGELVAIIECAGERSRILMGVPTS